eukprot:UN22865
MMMAVMDQTSVCNLTPLGVPKLAIVSGSHAFRRNPYKHASRKSFTSFTVFKSAIGHQISSHIRVCKFAKIIAPNKKKRRHAKNITRNDW